jgi:branched-chain amino acid transport system substrate-binding protein
VKRMIPAVIGAVLAVAVAGCSSSTASSGTHATTPSGSGGGTSGTASGDPIKIGFANLIAGPVTTPGWGHGVDAAVKYVNSKLNGVNGRPIKILQCSKAIDATVASGQACGQQFANDSSVSFGLTGALLAGGSFYSAMHAANKPIYGGIPITAADNSSPGVNFFLGGGAISGTGPGVLVKKVVPNVQRVNVLYLDTPSGQAQYASFKQGVGSGVNVVGTPVSDSATDLLSPVNAVVSENPDAIVVLLTDTACAPAVKAFDIVKPKVPVFTNTQCANPNVAKAGSVEGWYFVDYDQPASIPPGASPDMDAYKALYPSYASTPSDEVFAPEGWAQVLTLRSILLTLKGDYSSATVTKALGAFTGPVTLGPQSVKCPGPQGYEANCALTSQAFSYQWKDGHASLLPENLQLSLTFS